MIEENFKKFRYSGKVRQFLKHFPDFNPKGK